jgi:glycosyltransferase involved in cell wall biosynthesis
MKKLLYVAPHLSTGGLPQYLTKKIELLKDEFEIYLVEWADVTGGRLIVTRNKILKLVDPNKFFTLGENKMELIDIINRIQPDIVHTEEIPEFYMDFNVASALYNPKRKYILVETSHDSSFDTTQKKFFPDKFMFVSNWQIEQYKDIDIPSVLVEYPIEYVERPDREEALHNLQLDPAKKHVLHVGLYTSRKNQAEFFEYAKQFPEYEFHSLGNRADNFKWYWEPLEQDTPPNLTWWNERTDVDKFYQAMDLFLFTSRGSINDKETMPLVIREAISNQIPTLIYNLEVYQNYFDKFDTVDYLDFSSFENNCELIKEILETEEEIYPEQEAIVISTYPVQQSIIDSTKECIESFKKTGRKIILTSHAPIPLELQELVDYCVYDKNNLLTKHDFYYHCWVDYGHFSVNTLLKGEDNDVYHGPAVYTNYYNAASLAKNIGFKKLYFINYDYVLTNPNFIDDISFILNKKKAYVDEREYSEGLVSATFFFGIQTDFFFKTHEFISTAAEYDNLKNKVGSLSNGYENIFYFALLPFKNQIHTETSENWDGLIAENFKHNNFSRIEYTTVLQSNIENYFAVYYQNSNESDNRTLIVSGEEEGVEIFSEKIDITHKFAWYRLYQFTGKEITFSFKFYDAFDNKFLNEKVIVVNQDYLDNKIQLNGNLETK